MPSLPIGKTSQQSLIRAAKSGDQQAIETLITGPGPVRGLISALKRECDPGRIAQRWEPTRGSGRPDEADAAAHEALLLALRQFDPDRGVAFTTFARPYIRGAMLRAIYPVVRRKADPRPIPRLVEYVGDHGDDTAGPPTESTLLGQDPGYGSEYGYTRMIRLEEKALIRRVVAALPDNQRAIVEAVYFEGRTQDDLAVERRVSHQAISKAHRKALDRARLNLADIELVAA